MDGGGAIEYIPDNRADCAPDYVAEGPETINYDEILPTFGETCLTPELLRGMRNFDFQRPSPIQQRATMPIINGRNVIAQVKSGTYNTPTYSIAVLQKIAPASSKCQALILTPTPELAQTIQKAISVIGQFLDIKCHAVVGGVASHRTNIAALRGPCQVVIGTPGRVHDLIRRGVAQVDEVKMLILEDADDIVSREFEDDVYSIVQQLAPSTQIVLLASRMHEDVLQFAARFMPNPIRIMAATKEGELSLAGLSQFFVKVDKEEHKYDTLKALITKAARFNTFVIFCAHRQDADLITRQLTADGHIVCATHGGMTEQERQKVVIGFQSSRQNILVTSDPGSYATDLWPTHLLINLEIPESCDQYMRRVGQAWKYPSCRREVAITLVQPKDLERISEIRSFFSTEITELPNDTTHII